MKRQHRPAPQKELRTYLEQRRRDVALAHERIGTTVDARCRWLLDDLAPRDPDTLATAERAILRDNLLALAEGQPRTGTSGLPAQLPGQTMSSVDDPPDDELHALWKDLVALTRAHAADVTLPPVTERLWQRSKGFGSQRVRLERFRESPNFRTALLHRAADILAACERLRECPECHLLFVANRRQERHPKCARKARDARRPSRAKKGAQ